MWVLNTCVCIFISQARQADVGITLIIPSICYEVNSMSTYMSKLRRSPWQGMYSMFLGVYIVHHATVLASYKGRYKTVDPRTKDRDTKSQNTNSFITTLHYRRLCCIVVQVSNTIFLSLKR